MCFQNSRFPLAHVFASSVLQGFKWSSTKLSIPATVAVSLQNVTARWQLPEIANPLQKGTKGATKGDFNAKSAHQTQATTLHCLSVDFEKGKLIGVIGPVGAGKSSLLQVILRELPAASGSVSIAGSLSYASQEPWVFAGTVRQNVLFGQAYEKERYGAVIKACALDKDLEQLPDGDRTVIGERGTSLSGGQKARVK